MPNLLIVVSVFCVMQQKIKKIKKKRKKKEKKKALKSAYSIKPKHDFLQKI